MGIYIIGDVIRNTRIAMNLSQEELAEGICMPNYLSRIECGKQVPQKKIYDMLMDKMESHMNRMTVSLDVDEFELLEKRWDIAIALADARYEKAQELLWELEVELDQTSVINRQYIEMVQLTLDKEKKKITLEEYKEKLIQSLHLTIPDYYEEWIIKKILSHNEVSILMKLYGICGEEGKYEKSLSFYEELQKYYEELYPRGNEHYYRILLSHMSKWYGLLGKHKKAIEMAKKGISECKRGKKEIALPHFLYDIAWNINELLEKNNYPKEKEEKMKKARKQYVLQAYGISLAYGQRKYSLFYKRKFEIWFGTEAISTLS